MILFVFTTGTSMMMIIIRENVVYKGDVHKL